MPLSSKRGTIRASILLDQAQQKEVFIGALWCLCTLPGKERGCATRSYYVALSVPFLLPLKTCSKVSSAFRQMAFLG